MKSCGTFFSNRTLAGRTPSVIPKILGGSLSCLLLGVILLANFLQRAHAGEPRIVNLYNFVRNSDYRVPNSEEVLFETTRQQIQLIKKAGLSATWALQYDALINPRYQKLFKEQLGPRDEIAAWWEIPRPLAEKAGLKWRGRQEWDSAANVGFSPGYNPEERRKLVDVCMADFKVMTAAITALIFCGRTASFSSVISIASPKPLPPSRTTVRSPAPPWPVKRCQ